MAVFLNGVTIVLCGEEQGFEGATIAWATKIEKDHALVSLPSEAPITMAILSKKVFSISVLAHNQSNIARQYGGSKQAKSLLRNIHDLDLALWGVPVVKNCHTHLLCETVRNILVNEQTVLIAKITDSGFSENAPPLVYDPTAYFDP